MKPASPVPPSEEPPRRLTRLLLWLIAPHWREEAAGDLCERYTRRVRTHGRANARLRYWLELSSYLRPAFLKRKPDLYPSPLFPTPAMIKNYFKIGLRNLVRSKGYSAINIGGLAAGMAVAMLIGLWIYDELSFNKVHEHYASIGQVNTRINFEGEEGVNNTMQYPMGTELKTNYSQYFSHIVMTSWGSDQILAANGKKFSRTGLFMEPGAPEMLSLKMRYGTRQGLAGQNSIMLSESTARAFFGDTDPTGKIIKLSNRDDLKVTGVFKDLPANSQFKDLKFLSPFTLWVANNPWISERAMDDWENHFLKIYVKIKPGLDFTTVSDAIRNAELKNLGELKEQARQNPQVFILPMSDWHLHSYRRGKPDTANLTMVWQFGIVGAIVLFLACINFMNLTTARSAKRAREVGVRKSVGSKRGQLIAQFFSESFLVVILAYCLALGLAVSSLSWFNSLAAKDMVMPWGDIYFWTGSLCFVALTGFLAGCYPALYLSSFQPVKVLKGTFRVGRFAALPRKALVIVQFTVSVSLVIGTIVVYRQIQLAKDRPVGYTREGLLMIAKKSEDFNGKYDVLRRELKNTGAVMEMAESMGKVTELASGNIGFDWKGKDPNLKAQFGTLAITTEYGKTVGWEFVQGRDFSRAFTSDSSGMVINESAARYLKMQNPIGAHISWKFQDQPARDFTILGVVKDMLMESPYERVYPTMYMIKAHVGTDWIDVRLNPGMSVRDALPKVESVFQKLIPSAPFEYKFADEEFAGKFAAEERVGRLAGFFSGLAILISCLGLLGLASFMAEQRTKEIGIRKVLGASVGHLWQLLSKDFVVLVTVSSLISIPISWYCMNEWLQKFTYRTEISWWIFIACIAGALTVTLLTVSFQAVRTALLNPVKTLRSE
nr:ABC transporter permease [uncultured Dyadobacter sp.]